MSTSNPAMDSTSKMTPEARDLANQIFATIASEYVGFKLNTLKYYLIVDLHFNPDNRAREVGYANLKDLLESKEMESRIYWQDERNEHGEMSRVYKAKPNEDYADIYNEQLKAHNKAKKQKERLKVYGGTEVGPAAPNQQQEEMHQDQDRGQDRMAEDKDVEKADGEPSDGRE